MESKFRMEEDEGVEPKQGIKMTLVHTIEGLKGITDG